MKLVFGIFEVPDDDELVQEVITEEDIEALDKVLAKRDNGVVENEKL